MTEVYNNMKKTLSILLLISFVISLYACADSKTEKMVSLANYTSYSENGIDYISFNVINNSGKKCVISSNYADGLIKNYKNGDWISLNMTNTFIAVYTNPIEISSGDTQRFNVPLHYFDITINGEYQLSLIVTQDDESYISSLNIEIYVNKSNKPITYKKPVIYIYPQEITDVAVTLDFNGKLTCTYPPYINGWDITAYPDGKLVNHSDGKEYSYLFWEGISDVTFDMSQGFVVKGEDTAGFLNEKLEYLGLTAKESNDFIVYWLSIMQSNAYNLITFQNEQYTDCAKLNVMPEPDSVLRVFMVYKALTQPISIEEQEIEPFERVGFTVVEWGGTEID